MEMKNVKFFRKKIKWIIFGLTAVFLLGIVCKRNATSRQTGEAQVSINKLSFLRKTSKPPYEKSGGSGSLPPIQETPASFPLKDLFKLPCNRTNNKFNLPFVSTQKNKTIQEDSYVNTAYNPMSKNFPKTYGKSSENMPNFINNIKFKRFSKEKPPNLSVLFITNKIALVKIGGKKYYVRSGMDVKGNYILSISLSSLSYSHNGKIKIKHLSVN